MSEVIQTQAELDAIKQEFASLEDLRHRPISTVTYLL